MILDLKELGQVDTVVFFNEPANRRTHTNPLR